MVFMIKVRLDLIAVEMLMAAVEAMIKGTETSPIVLEAVVLATMITREGVLMVVGAMMITEVAGVGRMMIGEGIEDIGGAK